MFVPLSERIRPQDIKSVFGQRHILNKFSPLTNMISQGFATNMIFYGPPGTGKSTVAKIVAKNSNMDIKQMNGTTVSSSDIKSIIDQIDTFIYPKGVLIYMDEIQYLNKKQQQVLLDAIEKGKIVLIASTTENPYFYVYNALMSRCSIFEFKPPSSGDIKDVIKNAVSFLEKEQNFKIVCSDEILTSIANFSGGDVRKAINTLELCVLSAEQTDNSRILSTETLSQIIQKNNISYNKTGDEHYDIISAFQKSMRGSDPDAAIHYLARLLDAGDIISACRRLLVCACEDVGLAHPQIIPIVKSCVDIAMQVGMPEARIPLADAVILVCNSPKSNSAYNAINSASIDIKNHPTCAVPRHLQNVHCDSTTQQTSQNYLYPHDYKNHWVKQQYLPDCLKNSTYYNPSQNKNEQAYKHFWDNIKNL